MKQNKSKHASITKYITTQNKPAKKLKPSLVAVASFDLRAGNRMGLLW